MQFWHPGEYCRCSEPLKAFHLRRCEWGVQIPTSSIGGPGCLGKGASHFYGIATCPKNPMVFSGLWPERCSPGGTGRRFAVPPGNLKGRWRRMRGSWNDHSLRIQLCPKKGISPIILFWGWDWDHQSYSREGSGFLGLFFFRLLPPPRHD